MHHTNRACSAYRAIAFFILYIVTTVVQAQSVSTPNNVSALIYSTSASELFWTPQPGSLVEVTRNGELLGRFDAQSLYQPGLQAGKQYSYTLRSVDSSGRLSQAVSLGINTANFISPDQRIYPATDDNVQSRGHAVCINRALKKANNIITRCDQ